jgi:hypothetical protein
MNYIEIEKFTHDILINRIYNKLFNLYERNFDNDNYVDNDGIKIFTINGFHLLKNIPEVLTLYNYTFKLIKNNYHSNLVHLNEIDIAISANILSYSKSDSFRLHFDRNQITCIIYLSNNSLMPLKLYSNVRLDPLIFGKKEFILLNFNSILVFPKKNSALIFNGNRSFHGIEFLNNDNDNDINDDLRLSIQFAFNLSKAFNFINEGYYGRR